jgi:hypothetical protein
VRRRTRLAVAALAIVIAGCGEEDEGGPAADPATFTVLQPTRSGSFFGGDGDYELVLRGVGGTTAIGADSAVPGGSAGAVATSALARRPEDLLGPPPWPATIGGAEVLPQAFSLELSSPEYDGVRQELRFDATVTAGLPETPPPSFGAATVEISSTLAAGSLSGAVVSAGGVEEETGTPIEGALVEVSVAGEGVATALTDTDGAFEIGPLPDTTYVVLAGKPGYARERRPTGIGDEPELQLVPMDGAPTLPPEGDSTGSISE